jgi:hypothetical protein
LTLKTTLLNFHHYFLSLRGSAAGQIIPRVTNLLTDPAFAALKTWLLERKVPLDELQAQIDELLDQARQAALETLGPPPPNDSFLCKPLPNS